MAIAADNDDEATVRLWPLPQGGDGLWAECGSASARSRTKSRRWSTTSTESIPTDRTCPSTPSSAGSSGSNCTRSTCSPLPSRRAGRGLRHHIEAVAATAFGREHGIGGHTRDLPPPSAAARLQRDETVDRTGPGRRIRRSLAGKRQVAPSPRARPPTGASSSPSRRPPSNGATTRAEGPAGHVCRCRPKSPALRGRHLIVGGTGRTQEADNGAITGDLSAIIIDNLLVVRIPPDPSRSIALMADWEENRHMPSTIDQDVRIVAGVPSWTQVLLERILDLTGKTPRPDQPPPPTLHARYLLRPYREAFDRMMPPGIHTIETYNAGEGFFAIRDRLGADDILLMLDCGIH